jgi:hypothetical protein
MRHSGVNQSIDTKVRPLYSEGMGMRAIGNQAGYELSAGRPVADTHLQMRLIAGFSPGNGRLKTQTQMQNGTRRPATGACQKFG